ncbi:YoaK family protein [Spirillospora sp. NPDC029432]|uniref:YoaK family protein n=1 Tax=Spirillospora sp. NPDC029432 TaxID=3154599 RepID=UPI0034545C69
MSEKRDHGPLPVLLIFLTAITGLIDAVSYLEFGNVFVANMTGNVIFFGFRLGGSGEASGALVATTVASVFFCLGAAIGGRLPLIRRLGHRGIVLSAGTAIQACVLAVAALLVTLLGHAPAFERRVLIPLLATAMGWQFAIVRRIDVPGFRTVVITTALTSLVADPGQPRRQAVHKAQSIVALLLGAMAGPLLIRNASVAAPLWVSAAMLLLIAAAGLAAARRDGSESWG